VEGAGCENFGVSAFGGCEDFKAVGEFGLHRVRNLRFRIYAQLQLMDW
jgi:hypothetical protein